MFLPSDLKLCQKSGCPERSSTPGLQDWASARLWLQALQQSPSRMREIRTFLANDLGAGDLYRVSDQMVIDRLAYLLASGHVHLHQGPLPADRQKGGSVQAAIDEPVPFPISRSTPPAVVSQAPTADDFLPDVDLLAQAATLIAAASSGKPFCPE